MNVPKRRVVLFASGTGSNVQAILQYFQQSEEIEVVHLFCNNAQAGVLNVVRTKNIPFTLLTNRKEFQSASWLSALKELQPDLIVLAGFLWKIPAEVIAAYPNRIINIHPALLPKYGGRGMYGQKVHEAVLANGEQESGITIHYVNEHYDEGQIIVQVSCPILPEDDVASLSARIHQLEHAHLPLTIERILVG